MLTVTTGRNFLLTKAVELHCANFLNSSYIIFWCNSWNEKHWACNNWLLQTQFTPQWKPFSGKL